MKCVTCNYDMPSDVTYCPNCGARVPDAGRTASSAGAPTVQIGRSDDRRITTELDERDLDESPARSPYGLPPAPAMPAVPQGTLSPAAVLPEATPNSTAAVVSLVFGILGWMLLPLIGPIVAVVAGHIGRRQIRASEGRLGGSGMATGGLILGYLQLGLIALGCIAVALFLMVAGTSIAN
jgi:hypothetical protein